MAKKIIGLVAIVTSHVFLLSRMMFFPYPELFVYPYLTNLGLTPYSQLLDQHFPGLMFFPINLASLGIDTPAAMFSAHIFIVIFIHLFVFLITLSMLKDYRKSVLANLFVVLWHPYLEGNVLWIDSFIPLFLLPAALLIYFGKNKLPALLIGLSFVLKQVVAPLAVLLSVYVLVSRGRRAFLDYCIWFVIPPALMTLYFLKIGVFDDFFYWTVIYNLTIFSEMGRKFATRNELIKVLFIFGPSLVYSLYLIINKRKESIYGLFLIFSLAFAYARFDFVHLQPALPFIAIIFALIMSKLPRFLASNFIVLYILFAAIVLSIYHSALKSKDVKFFTDDEYRAVAEIKKYASINDPIFSFATLPHIYYLSDTRPSGNVFVMQFPWFSGVSEDKILAGLLSEPAKVIISQPGATTGGMNISESMPNIKAYIEKNYTIVDKIGEVEILIPNESSN